MKVRLINNPFDIDDIVSKDSEYEYQDCKFYFNKYFDCFGHDSFRVICSGKDVEYNYIPSMYDEITFVRAIHGGKGGFLNFVLGAVLIVAGFLTGGLTTTFGMMLISAGVGMIVGGLAQLFMPKADVKMDNMDNTPTYSWDGIQNIVGEGNVVPVVYGVHRVGGAFIEGYVDGASENGNSDFNYLYLMTALSEGEVHKIHEDTVMINGNPLWTYMTGIEEIKSYFVNPKTKAIETVDGIVTASMDRIKAEEWILQMESEARESEGGREGGFSSGGGRDSGGMSSGDQSGAGQGGWGR